MKFYLTLVCLSVSVAFAATKKAPLVSLEEKNKAADTAFIRWRLDAPGSTISQELRGLLTPEAITFLVNQAQLPFTRYMSKEELKNKVNSVINAFVKRFNPDDKVKINSLELEELATEIIMPEYAFQIDPALPDKPDKAYNELLDGLSFYKTTAGTFLNEWALRFLTSESQFIALSVIKRDTRDGEPFNKLSDADKVKILDTAGDVIVHRFMFNLGPVQRKFGFKIPPHADRAVKKRVDLFLREKFGL